MTSWSATDLVVRLCRALDLASQVLTEFGATGYTDELVPSLSFGPDKPVAETAMLLHAASSVSDHIEVSKRIDAVAHQLVPYVRSRRALADMALRPARAFKHAVPHVLLTSLGFTDDVTDGFFRSRCALALDLAADLPPSARLERRWIATHWGQQVDVNEPTSGIFLDRPIDVFSEAREDAYSLTHQLFYLTDFGRAAPPVPPRPLSVLLSEFEGLLLRYLDLEDYDLSGELLMAWPQLRAPWGPTAAFAFRVLTRVEDEAGMLPCGNVDLGRLNDLEAVDRRRYALATSYHTAFVMGFLCAVSLKDGSRPPNRIEGLQYDDSVWQGFLQYIDNSQGHWVDDFAACNDTEKRALAPLLCQFAILQKLRKRDFAGLHEVLLFCATVQMPADAVQSRAADVLTALGEAMDTGTRTTRSIKSQARR